MTHEQVLGRAGLTCEGRFNFVHVQRWTVESLIGLATQTSILSRGVLEHYGAALEIDLRATLLTCCGDGIFDQEMSLAYELARR
jgi:hypothetical protein